MDIHNAQMNVFIRFQAWNFVGEGHGLSGLRLHKGDRLYAPWLLPLCPKILEHYVNFGSQQNPFRLILIKTYKMHL